MFTCTVRFLFDCFVGCLCGSHSHPSSLCGSSQLHYIFYRMHFYLILHKHAFHYIHNHFFSYRTILNCTINIVFLTLHDSSSSSSPRLSNRVKGFSCLTYLSSSVTTILVHSTPILSSSDKHPSLLAIPTQSQTRLMQNRRPTINRLVSHIMPMPLCHTWILPFGFCHV